MGCATSHVTTVEVARDAYATKASSAKRLAQEKNTRRNARSSSKQHFVSLSGVWRDPPSPGSYRSYSDTPMDAPNGMFTLPDREMHEEHLIALERLRVLIEKYPIRFANEIDRARNYRFPSVSHPSEQECHKASHKERIDRKAHLKAVLASNRSEQNFKHHNSLASQEQDWAPSEKSRVASCSTSSKGKMCLGKSISPISASTVTPNSSGMFDNVSADSSLSATESSERAEGVLVL